MAFVPFRKPIIAANWKMHMTPQETDDFLRAFARLVPEKCPVQIVVSPPFVSLCKAQEVLQNAREENVELAAQNMSQHPAGAYTGEISARMIIDCGCKHVILGHSERRSIYGETNAIINAKVLAALEARLLPILCIGETLAERDGGQRRTVQRAVGQQDLLTEVTDECGKALGAGFNHLAGDDVTVDDHTAAFGECPRHRGLPGADAAGQPDAQHVLTPSPVTS